MSTRKPYSSDVSDDEWAFVAPYLTMMNQEAPQRQYPLRELFNALRHLLIIFSTANKNLLVSEPESISKFIFLCSISYQMGYGSSMPDGKAFHPEGCRR